MPNHEHNCPHGVPFEVPCAICAEFIERGCAMLGIKKSGHAGVGGPHTPHHPDGESEVVDSSAAPIGREGGPAALMAYDLLRTVRLIHLHLSVSKVSVDQIAEARRLAAEALRDWAEPKEGR